MNLDSGRLLAANVSVVDAARLADSRYVEDFLRALTARIGMRPLTEPMSVVIPPEPSSVQDPHADDGGMTTQVIISTSHIAYHSWPLQRRFRLVVDSCKFYDVRDVMAVLREWFPVNGLSLQNMLYLPPEMLNAEEAQTVPPQKTETAA